MMSLIESTDLDKATEPTAIFFKMINDLFDLMNSKKICKNNTDEYTQVNFSLWTIRRIHFL